MARVFISYRRQDSPYAAMLIHKALVARFGLDQVFLDIENILSGQDWRQRIDRELSDCKALIVVMGKKWKRLLSEHTPETDFVRYEIKKARQKQATFFTVLVDDVSNRSLKSLPNDLHFLESLNSHTLGIGTDSREQLSRLVEIVSGCVDPRIPVDMVPVPAGEYTIGSSTGESYEQPVKIRLTRRFKVSRCYLTMRELEILLGSEMNIPREFPKDSGTTGDLLPAHNLSWFDAIHICNCMSRCHGLQEFYEWDEGRIVVPDWSAHGFRLPTEAEWEVACQLGLPGEDLATFSPVADRTVFGLDSDYGEPAAIGDPRVRQDKSGCCGMLGNIREWCFDTFSLDAYDEFRAKANGGHCIDPIHNLVLEPDRVVRGGCYCDPEYLIRPWRRQRFSAANRDPGNGMRFARTCDC